MNRCTKLVPACIARAIDQRECTCSPYGSGMTLEGRVAELERSVKALVAQGIPTRQGGDGDNSAPFMGSPVAESDAPKGNRR